MTGHKDGTVRVWRDGAMTLLAGAKLEHVMNAAFSPGGDVLVAGDNDGNVAAWDAKSLELIRVWKTAGTAAAGLAFSPDSRRLAVVDAGTARVSIIDFRDETATSFDGECERSFSAAFRGDGRTLVTGCNDGSLELLDVVTRERLGSIPDHEDPPDPDFVMDLARHPREERFAAGTEDGRVMIWHLEPAFWMRRACRRANRDAEEIPEWTGDALVPCSILLKDAPPDIRKPDVERDENDSPRVPIDMAILGGGSPSRKVSKSQSRNVSKKNGGAVLLCEAQRGQSRNQRPSGGARGQSARRGMSDSHRGTEARRGRRFFSFRRFLRLLGASVPLWFHRGPSSEPVTLGRILCAARRNEKLVVQRRGNGLRLFETLRL